MVMNGHKVVRILDNWVLDIFEYKVYKVSTTRQGRVSGVEYVCKFNEGYDGKVTTSVITEVPLGVIRIAQRYIRDMREARRNMQYAL